MPDVLCRVAQCSCADIDDKGVGSRRRDKYFGGRSSRIGITWCEYRRQPIWEGDWERSKSFIKDCHFLVMHLTYIESILRVKYGKEFSEDDSEIGYFIEKELKPLILEDDGKIRENFVFVVTTGRGRNKWWDRLKESKNPAFQAYKLFTIFRPVESIISIVENAINKEDDIELKYYLAKLLFGS